MPNTITGTLKHVFGEYALRRISHFTQPFFCAINFEQDRKYMYIVDFILQLRELKEYHT